MDLFLVNRYMGEDELTRNDKNNEAAKMEALKKHIEQRKRKIRIEWKKVDEEDSRMKKEIILNKDERIAGKSKKKHKKKEFLLEDDVEYLVSPSNEELDGATDLDISSNNNLKEKSKIDNNENNLEEEDGADDGNSTIEKISETSKMKRNKKEVLLEENEETGWPSNGKLDEGTVKKKKKTKSLLNVSNNNTSQVENKVDIDENDLEDDDKEVHSTEDRKPIEISNGNATEFGFTIIGSKKKKKDVKKVEKALPDWLANPHVIDTDLSSNLLPVEELAILSKHILSRLEKLNIKSFFPIQKAVIPAILNQIQKGSVYGLGGYCPSDICVSAPTGSGKTLSYVIPIVQALSIQSVCLLQALVLLPTKDLAFQVKQVFEAFVKGTGLKVGLVSGNKALAKEQESLIGQGYGSFSRVNILVATPGRLVDHLSYTPHFTLQHLRFLVIDEADRLLDQSYHDWLNKVLGASYVTHSETEDPIGCVYDGNSIPILNLQTSRNLHFPLTPARYSHLQLPLQKLLFSATMTHSPEKLAPLQLNNPALFLSSKPPEALVNEDDGSSQGTLTRYSVPHGLTEYMIICNAGDKPLVLLYLMAQKKLTGVLCFTSSLEATHRLCLLVKLFGGIEVAEYSSNLNAQQRHGILRDFSQGSIHLLICSDAMARGMDIESVSYVISYDAPKFVKTYIHRVGRTARAGNEGTAYTLLHSDQVHHFKELIQKTGREKIPKQTIKDEELKPLVEKYQKALEKLEEAVKNEKQEHGYRTRGQDEAEKYLRQQLLENIGR